MFRFGLALCSLLLTTPAPASVQDVADRIYYGGDIVTLDNSLFDAEAVAVSDGRISAVGTLAEVVRMRGAGTELIDLDGRTLVPGFIDAHGHLSRVGFQAIAANLLRPPAGMSRSIAGLAQTLKSWLETAPQAREFGLVLGFGFDESQLTNRRWLTRFDLDSVSADLPVIAIHRSGHMSVFNSPALELAGIRAETPEPEKGRIHRYTDSFEPTGVLEGEAHYTALRKVLSKLAQRDLPSLIDAGQHLYARFGHTTAQDARPAPAILDTYSRMAADGRLKIDIVAYPDLVKDGNNPVLRGPLCSQEYVNGFRVGGVMLRMEGALRRETARLRRSYLRVASGPLNRIGGDATFEDEEAEALLKTAFRNGWQVMVYADGEAAINQFLGAARAASAAVPGGSRPVMIQGQSLGAERISGLLELPGTAAIFPERIGGARPADRHIIRTGTAPGEVSLISQLTDRGMMFTAYHDAPASTPDAMRVLAAVVEAAGPGRTWFEFERRAIRMAALKSVTLWAAQQYDEAHIKGSITTGKLADLAILSANPLTVAPGAIDRIVVEETVKEGETVFWQAHEPEPGAGKKTKERDPPLACGAVKACFDGLTTALNRAGVDPGSRDLPAVPGRSASLSEH